MNENWPFDQPKNCASFTISQIMNGELPILVVYHDLEDDGWQFLSNTELRMEDAMIVALEEIVKIDDSVLKVAMIEPGFHAWRKSTEDKWIIAQTPIEENE